MEDVLRRTTVVSEPIDADDVTRLPSSLERAAEPPSAFGGAEIGFRPQRTGSSRRNHGQVTQSFKLGQMASRRTVRFEYIAEPSLNLGSDRVTVTVDVGHDGKEMGSLFGMF